MANIFDRLQFVKHEEIFATREEAYNYVLDLQIFERPSLVAEPMILLYESDDAEKGPNVILAIGSVGNGKDASNDNRTFFIDTQKTEEEIIALDEKIEQAIKSLTIIPVDSETLDISAEKTDDGTFLSGDVKIADYTIASGKVQNNIIKVDGQWNRGLYAFVDMDYDPETFVITFNVNGVTKEFQLPPDQHVEKGWYSTTDEAIYLKLADGSKVKIDVVKLIDEWTVLSSASTTPIMLFKEHVSSYTETHDGVYDWQDLLTADVRVADHINDNILHKDRTGRYLYVKGTADNIQYKNGLTVADALDNVDTKVSTSAGNMIYRRPDGLFASAMLDYNSAENKLIYRYTDTQTEDFKEVSFTLNSVKILQDITYDPVKEVIVIRYIDAQGEYQRVEIPAKDIIEEWIVNNEAHNIELVKYRSEGQGKDILSADAKIHAGDNNILEDKDHKLYVNGVSANIKYEVTGDTTVKDVLDELSGKTIATDVKLDAEIERAKAAEKELEDTIGSGFTSDPHENVTAKFEELSGKVDSEIERSTTKDEELEAAIAAEQARAEAAEEELKERVDAIDDEIDNLQDEIDAVSADSASSLKDIINNDKSIEIDKTIPTKPVISVKLSEHEGNTIRLIQQEGLEGLFNFVDLTYDAEHNKLTFTKSTPGATDIVKEIQLESISFIDEIYYDKNTEELVIVYYSGHERKEMRIPLRDLIDEWDVYNDVHSAVVLTKVWDEGLGKNILSAEVRISEKEDNILENQEGKLYVSNSAITANAAAIAEEVERATEAEGQLADDIDALSGAIDTEVERATTAEQTLQTNINNEVSRATDAEETLQENIDNEEARAEAAEEVLTNKIGSGFTDDVHENVTAKFEALSGKLDTEIADRIADVDAEQARAEAAETDLQSSISAEGQRAQDAETALSGAITTETSRAETAEQALSGAIDTEVERATDAERTLQTNIDTENIRAISAETALQTALNTETARATSAETRLEHLIEDEATARANADSVLTNNLNAEVTRATSTENRIETALNNEISRATSAETELSAAITAETLRAQAADNELYQKIADETADRAAGDANLSSLLNQEISRAQVAENTISEALATERNNRINDVTNLTNALTAETEARQAKDAELEQMIIDATLTFDDTASIDFNIPSQENNVVKANVKLQEGENIIKLGSGLYATVSLSYDSARNTIKLVTSNGEQEAIQLNTVGSLIDGMEYDATNRALVIKYHDAAGNPKEISFPVNQLFNDWEVDNPSSNSAIKLTKTSPVEPDDPDKLSAQALITDDFNGDGKPDEGSPNIIEIRNNGLFVDGTPMEEAKEIAECVKNECKTFETAVIGHIIGNECGSGYTYERNNLARYINTATSFNNADVILDVNLDRIENYADEISAKTDCVDSKAEALYKMLYTNASPIPECGSGATYQPYQGACVISAATSFMDADMLLNDQICEILEMWVSGETCTSKSTWTDDGANKKMMVDVKLSRGNTGTMSDDEIVIENLDGDYIDPTRTEFTDTNALRIVCLQEGAGGVKPSVDTPQNGVYLSNVWDCGLYYDEATDADAIAAAQAAGYLTDNYRTDTNPDASNYNYMNNVRQTDIPHE